MRLKQNLSDALYLCEQSGSRPQHLWNQHKSILQKKKEGRRPSTRNLRCSPKVLQKLVYVLDRDFDPEGEHLCAGPIAAAASEPIAEPIDGPNSS